MAKEIKTSQLPGVIWGGNDGAVYYLERIGNTLWWAGLSDGGELGPITKLRVVRQTGGFRATELELQA